ALFASGILVALMSGCYTDLDGHMHAGVPLVKDKIESRYERPVDQIFEAAKQVLSYNGTLTGENTITKTLAAKIDTRTVEVKVSEVEPKVSKVVVQARRKGGSADIDLASEIDKQIALRLTTLR
ncbi:MAG: hypothetical protein KGS61_15175, partial [Verrucomicrobia bacterium]|nr:hypothetical protein [Verrucomicrobiota bacterium]